MSEDGLGLNPAWSERIQQIGVQNFVKEEMLLLGFWKIPKNQSKCQELVKRLESHYEDLRKLRSDLREVVSEIEGLTDIDVLLQKVRTQRIERVRQEREVRAIQKAEERVRRQAEERERRLKKPTFLGYDVSAGLDYEGGNEELLEEKGLPLLGDAADIATALEVEQGEVSWLAYHRVGSRIDHYSRFTIPKRTGGERVISSPKPRLRHAQEWLLEHVLARLEPHPAAKAFRPGASIVDNARAHSGRGIVIRFDVKDFFPSITLKRVKGLYKSLGYNEGIATILALLCTDAPRAPVVFDGERRYVALGSRQLPQGACTSPAISNLIATNLDKRLTGLAKKLGQEWVYTRYADDMFFSHPDAGVPVGGLLRTVEEIVKDEGFFVHEEKTAVMRQPHRQYVTGLVVNETPRVPRRELRRFRALLHQCETQGFEAVTERVGRNALSHARGYLSFVRMVTPGAAESFINRYPWLADNVG